MPKLTSETYAELYERFNAPVAARHDCGRYCAPLNGGTPVCCDPGHAIPIVAREEWRLLKARTDLWRRFKPFDAVSEDIVHSLDTSCIAVECRGAAFCEGPIRSLACRTFPFVPYITRDGRVVGVSIYWTFRDRCWIQSRLDAVDPAFVAEMLATYETVFQADPDERVPFVEQSASMRRVFSRWREPIPVLTADGAFLKVRPKSGGALEPASVSDFAAHGPFVSKAAYRKAARALGASAKAVRGVLPQAFDEPGKSPVAPKLPRPERVKNV
ncbi:MAG: hypothetical protein AAGB03_02855 [Pseudomonadota bacterium]